MITDLANLAASLKPNLAANSNERESESTGWNDPSVNVTLRESISNPPQYHPCFLQVLELLVSSLAP